MMSKMFTPTRSRILGIDPGYGRVGIAVLDKTHNSEILLHSECFQTESNSDNAKRISLIIKRIGEVIDKFKPDYLAIETILWSKNKKTAMQVAEARGAIISLASQRNLQIREFNPNQVKLAITGYGKSDKQQVMVMVEEKIVDSKSEWRRLVEAGAASDYPDKKITDPNDVVGKGERKIKIGKKTFVVVKGV